MKLVVLARRQSQFGSVWEMYGDHMAAPFGAVQVNQRPSRLQKAGERFLPPGLAVGLKHSHDGRGQRVVVVLAIGGQTR